VPEVEERRRDEKQMEKFYYASMYDILPSPHGRINSVEALNI
jgi:hypothetical protein